MLCPNCKKEIPEGIQFCPECGADIQQKMKKKKPITKKWWFWVIIVVVLIGLIGAIGGGDDDSITTGSEGTSQSQNETASKDAESTTKKTTFNVGDTVNDSMLAITYVSAEEWKGYDQYFGSPADGNKIIRLKFDFINNGDVDAFISPFYCYADNQAAKDYYGGDETLSTFTLSAGRTTSGYVYFEVPENAKEIEVEYEVNAWTDKKAVFAVVL